MVDYATRWDAPMLLKQSVAYILYAMRRCMTNLVKTVMSNLSSYELHGRYRRLGVRSTVRRRDHLADDFISYLHFDHCISAVRLPRDRGQGAVLLTQLFFLGGRVDFPGLERFYYCMYRITVCKSTDNRRWAIKWPQYRFVPRATCDLLRRPPGAGRPLTFAAACSCSPQIFQLCD